MLTLKKWMMPDEEEPNLWDVIETDYWSDYGSYFGFDRILIGHYIMCYEQTEIIEWWFPCN